MSAFDLFQVLVVGGLVVFSTFSAFRKLLPETSRRMLGRLSAALDNDSRMAPLRRLGHWLQPAEARSGDCGTGGGCGSCNGCAPAPYVSPDDVHTYPLEIRPRPR